MSQFTYLACHGIGPGMAVVLLEEPLLFVGTPRERLLHTAKFYALSFLSVGIAVYLAEMGKAHQVWSGHPGFPSGHSTFVTSVGVCLLLQRGRRWAWLIFGLIAVMSYSLVEEQWHTWDEVAAAWVLGAFFPLVIFRIFRGHKRKERASLPVTPALAEIPTRLE